MTTHHFSVIGMTCEHCVASVREEVAELPGVRAVEVDLAGGDLRVDGAVERADVDAAVREAGYELAA